MRPFRSPTRILLLCLALSLVSLSVGVAPTGAAAGAGLPEALQAALFPVKSYALLQEGPIADSPHLSLLLTPETVTGVILVLDARNSTDQWQLNRDPSSPLPPNEGQWVDSGILADEAASGSFTPLGSVDEVEEARRNRRVQQIKPSPLPDHTP
ncbi:MAG: hypothetical protein HY713_00095 [candidate division NC10 bacterium]|nr:hypothetical protein [candidate division NC10 bacterium]